MKNVLVMLLTALMALIAPHAEAIEISIERGNATSKILVSGPIERGDAERFKAYWKENAYDSWNFIISLDSPGGNLLDGLEIGRFLRKVGANTEVQRYQRPISGGYYADAVPGAECYSACALAFMGGVERDIPEGGTIGFHQFYGGGGSSAAEAMEITQHISALIAGYLRDMGAKPELFELMSGTSPDNMFVPTRDEIAALNVVPVLGFHNFQLMPKNGLIVAIAIDERNPGPLEKVYEIETLCWKRMPIINLYAVSDRQGLSREMASPSTTHIDGFTISTDFGTFEYGRERLKLYPEAKLLASLIIDPNVARAVGSGNAMVVVNSYTASGVLMGGRIIAPVGGDPAIMASFRDCL